jgi:hypothetical protein
MRTGYLATKHAAAGACAATNDGGLCAARARIGSPTHSRVSCRTSDAPPDPAPQSFAFQAANLVIILANTAVMASVAYPALSPAWDHADDSLNLAFTAWFAAEMIVKVVGLGVRGYLAGGMNRWG